MVWLASSLSSLYLCSLHSKTPWLKIPWLTKISTVWGDLMLLVKFSLTTVLATLTRIPGLLRISPNCNLVPRAFARFRGSGTFASRTRASKPRKGPGYEVDQTVVSYQKFFNFEMFIILVLNRQSTVYSNCYQGRDWLFKIRIANL